MCLLPSNCMFHGLCIYPLPNKKIIDWSKLKAFVDDKINLNEKFKLVLGRVENIVGKEENVGYQPFFPFPAMFPKGFFLRVVKSQDFMVKRTVENIVGKGEKCW